MRYLSVCSGIEAISVAWTPLGYEPVAFSEIDPFPCAVLAHHYPHVPNLGDMTRYQEWPDAAIDVLVGGTPCQSFSVAGLRAGLDDPRGGLLLVYLAIARRYRPRWLVWENVPGVLSSDDGRAFGSLLGGLAELGYGFAYRVLDAQYFGLAQRRKRVFVVGCVGDWRRAAAVLFERASLSGHPAPRREARETITGSLGARTARSVGAQDAAGGMGRIDYESETLIAHSLKADGFDASEDGTGRGTQLVPMAFDWQSGGDMRGISLRPTAQLQAEQIPAVAFAENQRGEVTVNDTAGSLKVGGGKPGQGYPAIAFSVKDSGADAGELAPTLRAGGHTQSHANGGVMPAVAFAHQQGGDRTTSLAMETEMTPTLNRSQTMAVAHDTLYNKGISHASTQETHATALLRTLREEVGAEAFTEWGLGILDSLLPSEVLRSAMHGRGLRCSAHFSRRWLVYHALSRPEAHSEGLMLAMREAEREGCASQGWRPPEQLAQELGAYLSELSQPGAQAPRFMRDLWQAAEGLGLLRQALSAVQEVGRSARDEREPTQSSFAVRRLTVEECEFLQGFQRGYTAIPYGKRGRPAKDGPRYKALGNSMAVPVMRWIGSRIQQVESIASRRAQGAA